MNKANQNPLSKRLDQAKQAVKDDLVTWSNVISASRLLVAFPIVWLHYQNQQEATGPIIALVSYAILSDYLDGYIARITNRVTELGKILDPIADKLCAFVLFFYTVWIGVIPLWFFLLEIARDLLILIGSLYIQVSKGKVAMAVTSGKVSVNALALYWMIAFFFPDAIVAQQITMGMSLSLMVYSFFDYLQRFNLILNGADFN